MELVVVQMAYVFHMILQWFNPSNANTTQSYQWFDTFVNGNLIDISDMCKTNNT